MNKEYIFNFIKNNDINEIKGWLDLYPNDLNYKDNYGETPLHMACLNDHLEIVKLLIDKGADVNVKNDIGKIPLDYLNDDNRKIINKYIRYIKLDSKIKSLIEIEL